MVFKRCHEKGCTKAPRCDHAWHLYVEYRGDSARGPVNKFAFLLTRTQHVPRTQTEAIALEGLVRNWLIRGRKWDPNGEAPAPEAPAGAPLTIGDACDRYLEKYVPKLNGNGDGDHVRRIKTACGALPIADLARYAIVEEFLNTVAARSGATQSNRLYSRWSHLLNWSRVHFAEHVTIGPSPFYRKTINPAGIKKRAEHQRNRRLRPGEERALERAARTINDEGLMLGRLYCAIDAGLRKGEMLAIRREDIERIGGVTTLIVHRSKSGEGRRVPVTSRRLLAFLNRRRFAPFVFGDPDGARRESFRTEWEAVLIAAGLARGEYRGEGRARAWHWITKPDLHWHDLRHECGCRLGDRNMPIREIQLLLGHKSAKTTERYVHTDLTKMAQSMRRVHRAMGL